MELGKIKWRMVGIVIGLGVLGLLSLLIFNGLVYRFGALGGLLITLGILIAIVYRADRKKQREYDDA